MPLYEYFCSGCLQSFEALVPLSASQQTTHICPICGECSPRILSAVNFALARRTPSSRRNSKRNDEPDVTRLTLPPAERLCWMDDLSAARLAAYKVGRGAEYDDTVATRRELASQRGETETAEPAAHAHSHSPLSAPVVITNRRRAAVQEKVAASVTLRESDDTKEP
jgi:putative FmdB family regulatory protein